MAGGSMLESWVGRWVMVATSMPVWNNNDTRSLVGRLVSKRPDGILIELNGTFHLVNYAYIVCVSLPKNQDDFTIEAMDVASRQP